MMSLRWSCCYLVLFAALVFPASWSLAMPPTLDPTVVESSGEATYNIPTAVLPGPGGFTPTVSISYSSNGGRSQFGHGWMRTSTQISCSVRFGVPDYGSCERYEMDGQLLKLDPGSGRYHPFVETFERIVFVDGAGTDDHWVVTGPDGNQRIYGLTDNARLRRDNDTSSPIVTWYLAKERDSFGNEITYTYDTLGDLGVKYLVEIAYGAGTRSVDFVWTDQLDGTPLEVARDFRVGVETHITHLLSEIQILGENGVVARRRIFNYGGVHLFLESTQLFGTNCSNASADPRTACAGLGLPSQSFEYGPENPDSIGDYWEEAPEFGIQLTGGPSFSPGHVMVGDIDGDGIGGAFEGGKYPDLTAPELTIHWENVSSETGFGLAWGGQSVTDTMPVVMGAPEPPHVTSFQGLPTLRITPPITNHAEGLNHTVVVRPRGHWQLVDLNADGRADLVQSIKVSKPTKTTDATGTLLPASAFARDSEVILARRVLRNTGVMTYDATLGKTVPEYARDLNLEGGLPPIGQIMLDGTYAIREKGGSFNLESGGVKITTICGNNGLRGWESTSTHSSEIQASANKASGDICWNAFSLHPTFTDLNGDGFPDLIVLEREEQSQSGDSWDSPYVGVNGATKVGMRSVAYVQDPDAQIRWKRAPEFDLPRGLWAGSGPDYTGFTHMRPDMSPNIDHDSVSAWGCEWAANVPGQQDIGTQCVLDLDHGIRIIDVTRDGLADVEVAFGAIDNEDVEGQWVFNGVDYDWEPGFGPAVTNGYPNASTPSGRLINRGRGQSSGGVAVPYSAWCASGDLATAAAGIMDECSGYGSPMIGWIAAYDISTDTTQTMYAPADFDGDGYIDYRSVLADMDDIYFSGEQHTGKHIAFNWAEYGYPGDPLTQEDPERFWPLGMLAMDLNGDGIADLAGNNVAWVSKQFTETKLRRINTGRGGKITFEYAIPAIVAGHSRGHDPGSPLETQAQAHAAAEGEAPSDSSDDVVLWSPSPAVSKVVIEGPSLLNPATTEYEYVHPRYCVHHRAGLGFRLVKQTRADGSYVETSYYQKHGRAGQPNLSATFDDANKKMQENTWIWEFPPGLVKGSTTVPNDFNATAWAHLDPQVNLARLRSTRSVNHYWDGIASIEGAVVETTHFYDDHVGNSGSAEHGFNFRMETLISSATGALRIVETPRPHDNESEESWLPLLVARSVTMDENTGAKLSDTKFEYFTDPDPNGLLTSRVSKRTALDQRRDADPNAECTVAGECPEATFGYDGYGNLVIESVLTESTIAPYQTTEYCYDGDTTSWCPDFG